MKSLRFGSYYLELKNKNLGRWGDGPAEEEEEEEEEDIKFDEMIIGLRFRPVTRGSVKS
jgi:hypothetical protein